MAPDKADLEERIVLQRAGAAQIGPIRKQYDRHGLHAGSIAFSPRGEVSKYGKEREWLT